MGSIVRPKRLASATLTRLTMRLCPDNFGDNYYLNKRSCNFVDGCLEYCGDAAPLWMNSTCRTLLPGMQNITYDEYESILRGHVAELWRSYGNFTEIVSGHMIWQRRICLARLTHCSCAVV